MKKFALLAALAVSVPSSTSAQHPADILVNNKYTWRGDTIIQGPYRAWAVSPTELQSTYSAYPHYFMPVEKSWRLRNDISAYPRLNTGNKLLEAVYNMGLDEMVNAIEPDTTLRTGKEWAGVWTRDVSYSIILSMAYMQPQAAMISLRHKVNAQGVIVQDTGSGGAWPVSSDRMVWALAAWEIYKVTGSKAWLEYAYPIIARSMAQAEQTVFAPDGMVRGETSFIDWREQSYPKWMQTADIYQSEAMNTNVIYAATYRVLADMAAILGQKKEAATYSAQSKALSDRINDVFFMTDKGYYAMYRYGRLHPVLNPREETLGESLAILYGIASPERAVTITENAPVTSYGPAIFFPQISDMPAYHNNALWPFVASFWALANAKAGNEAGTLQAIGAVMRPAALFATNKENLNLDNGDIQTELNSSNMLWSLSGNIALTTRILFGIQFEPDGLRIAPVVPKALADTRSLRGFPYRGTRLNITVSGYGNRIRSLSLNGKQLAPDAVIPAAKLKGICDIKVVMADNAMTTDKVNNVDNIKAPVTPLTRIQTDAATGKPLLVWNPIEYIAGYRVLHNGKEVGYTRTTTWPVTDGEWQITGVASDGTESFASEPLYAGSVKAVQMPLEGRKMLSNEISYPAGTPVAGYRGNGFVEVDHSTNPLAIPITVDEAGRYAIQVRYANGNGPVNTENKAAIRTLRVDNQKVGTIVLPQRGVANWDDWGLSNTVIVELPAGVSTLTIAFEPSDENMNLATNHALLDAIIIRPVK